MYVQVLQTHRGRSITFHKPSLFNPVEAKNFCLKTDITSNSEQDEKEKNYIRVFFLFPFPLNMPSLKIKKINKSEWSQVKKFRYIRIL